jgi:ribonuclease P protein component
MLPKKQRLTRKEIDKILKGGHTVSSPSFRVKYSINNISFKVASVVSKKISKLAVTRNSLRREIYNSVLKHKEETKKLEGLNLVVFMQKRIEKENLDLELSKTLEKINI